MDYLFLLAVLQIVWIDVLLSGDNAVVIALACQSLPSKQRTIGLIFGVTLAVVARIVVAWGISSLLLVPFLKIVGGVLLLYIAVKVIVGEDDESSKQRRAVSLWTAICLIVVADITMSLDNVVAIAAASHGDTLVFMIGLALSMPLMIGGASLITSMVERLPLLVWVGGGLLGWIAGGMIVADPWIPEHHELWSYAASAIGVVLVVAAAYLMNLRRQRFSHIV